MLKSYNLYNNTLDALPDKQLLITTLNAHSYNVACKDPVFEQALKGSDVLIPDGISVVWAMRILGRAKSQEPGTRTLKKIAGEDLFYWEMRRLDNRAKNQESRQERKEMTPNHQLSALGEGVRGAKKKALFIGSTEEVLAKIKARAGVEFPHVEVHTYSPPYKPEFSAEDNLAMYEAISAVQPDVLFVGMTAPKQEKWAMKLVVSSRQSVVGSEETTNYQLPTNCHVCCIGAVFDFYAGTVKRAPQWIIKIQLEWFYRLVMEPRRMWRRYLVGNVKFVWAVVKEAVGS